MYIYIYIRNTKANVSSSNFTIVTQLIRNLKAQARNPQSATCITNPSLQPSETWWFGLLTIITYESSVSVIYKSEGQTQHHTQSHSQHEISPKIKAKKTKLNCTLLPALPNKVSKFSGWHSQQSNNMQTQSSMRQHIEIRFFLLLTIYDFIRMNYLGCLMEDKATNDMLTTLPLREISRFDM